MFKRLLLLSFLPFILGATELRPWLDTNFELQPRLTYLHQSYRSLAVSNHTVHRPAEDNFFDLSVGLSAFSYSAELEVILADTRHRSFGCDSIKLTGRYQWFNDLIDDPVSMTTGLTIIQAFKQSLDDVGSFHHGKFEMEAHLAIGQEITCYDTWDSRVWGVLALGSADVGSPWIRANLSWEKNWCETHRAALYLNTLWGFGNNKLNPNHFHGYGPIHHQSVDLGLTYSYLFEFGGSLDVGYTHRLYARNFPKNANIYMISILYPISPVTLFSLYK